MMSAKLVPFVLAALLAVSCDYKELCYTHPHVETVRVLFDWSDAPDAEPEGMDLLFYPSDGSAPLVRQIPGRDGGEVSLPVGCFSCLAYNSEDENLIASGTAGPESLALTTARRGFETPFRGYGFHESGFGPSDHGDLDCMLEPDILYASVVESFCVYSDRDNVITFKPARKTGRITVIIRNVSGIENILSNVFCFNGLSAAYLPFPRRESDEGAVLTGQMTTEGPGTLSCTFNCFGHHAVDGMTVPHIFSVTAVYSENLAYRCAWDVSDAVHDPSQDPEHIIVELEGMKIPEPIYEGSGMPAPSVDDWGEEIVIEIS